MSNKNTSKDATKQASTANNCYTVELMCCDEVMLQEISDPKCKRLDIAKTYALALRSSYPTDFAKVNKAIIERWSLSALDYITKMAWSGKCFQDSAV